MMESFFSLIDEISEKDLFVIGTVNDATNLPEPLKSRFGGAIFTLSLPDEDTRASIISYYICLNGMKNNLDADNYKELVRITDGFSARDIKKLIMNARQTAKRSAAKISAAQEVLTMDEINESFIKMRKAKAVTAETMGSKIARMQSPCFKFYLWALMV